MNTNKDIEQETLPAEMQEFISQYSVLYTEMYKKQHSERVKKGIAFKKAQNLKNNKTQEDL